MKLQICSIYDSAVETFGRPIFVQHVGQAIRSFSDEVRNKEGSSDLSKHASDFNLVLLGTFDDQSGQVEPIQAQTLLRGKDVASIVE